MLKQELYMVTVVITNSYRQSPVKLVVPSTLSVTSRRNISVNGNPSNIDKLFASEAVLLHNF